MHVTPAASFSAGTIMGAAAQFNVTVRGRGGHAAMPHTTIDPVVAGAAVVTALQVSVPLLPHCILWSGLICWHHMWALTNPDKYRRVLFRPLLRSPGLAACKYLPCRLATPAWTCSRPQIRTRGFRLIRDNAWCTDVCNPLCQQSRHGFAHVAAGK